MDDEETKNQNSDAVDETEIIPDEESSASTDAAARVKTLKEKLKQCDAEKKEYLDGWQRAKADHINYRKDEAKQFEDMARFVVSGFLADLLPALDSFEIAISHEMPKDAKRGILLIRSQLEDILKKRGLSDILAKEGEVFNPETHESIGEADSPHPAGTVAEAVQKGYLFQKKVLRPARVRLSKGKS